jgi:hypothetical protein
MEWVPFFCPNIEEFPSPLQRRLYFTTKTNFFSNELFVSRRLILDRINGIKDFTNTNAINKVTSPPP